MQLAWRSCSSKKQVVPTVTKVDPHHIAVHCRSRRRLVNRSDRLPLRRFLIPGVSSQTRTQRMSLPKHSKYRTIYADPPWPEYGGGKIKPGPERHYPPLSHG